MKLQQQLERMQQPDEPADVLFDVKLKVEVSLYGRDRGPAERWQHAVLVETGSQRQGERHARVLFPGPLQRYHDRRLLSDCEYPGKRVEENEERYDAGLRLLQAWEKAGRQPRMTATLGLGAAADRTAVQRIGGFEQWRDWGEAYLACGKFAGIVQAVCCFDEVASDYVRRKRHRRMGLQAEQLGLELLRAGLTALAGWYGTIDRRGRNR